MHIEPGVIDGAKMALAAGTAGLSAGYGLKLMRDDIVARSVASFGFRAVLASAASFVFFELLPHVPVGISEVHFILGTTLLLILGAGPAALGLAAGLLIQGLFFAPSDLPMYLVNVTTLLVPLFAIHALARRIIPETKAYVDLDYAHVLKLSATYQGGVITWVAFWAAWGQGFGAETTVSILSFGAAYLLVIVVEPIVDFAVLAAAKAFRGLDGAPLVEKRLYAAA